MKLFFLTNVGLEIQHNNCAPIHNHFHTDDFDQWTSVTAWDCYRDIKIQSKFNVHLRGNLKAIYIINVTQETRQLLLQAHFQIAGSKQQ